MASRTATIAPTTSRAPPSSAHLSHETLMGSMMAHSTPRVLIHSPIVRYLTTVLEVVAAFSATFLLITLFTLHIRFVRQPGCAPTLDASYLSFTSSPIVEISVQPCTASQSMYRFRFSQERGLLLLSDASLQGLNVSITSVPLEANDSCLGNLVTHFLLCHFIGYDTVAINAFARMRRHINSLNGYVLSLQSRRVLNLRHADPGMVTSTIPVVSRLVNHIMRRCGAIITAVFIMCTTAALVAFALREIQVRMIKLTLDLQVAMRSQAGYGRVVVRYATDALVFVPIIAGMLFFLFEFFDDQALAFAVLLITWLCELATSGSTRHWISRLYLPKLLFFYFATFHIYFFCFPLGFNWLSFSTSLALMVHAALAVWNHCEIPLLRNENHLQPHRT